jgi:cytochrome c-type biogenesis protein CcmH/NrfG
VITPAPEPPPLPPPEPIPPPAPAASSGATAALLEQSRQQSATGDYAMATSSLERALRINPRDAELWCELGRVKLRQGDAAQAQNMAQRGLAVAGTDVDGRAGCEAVLAEARRGR